MTFDFDKQPVNQFFLTSSFKQAVQMNPFTEISLTF